MRYLIFKMLFVLVVLCGAVAVVGQTSVDSMTINNIDGGSVSLLGYQGKKILFLISPSKIADSAKLNEIAAFNVQHNDSITLIGIMSKEDGYIDSNKTAIKNMYQNKGLNILLTEGMFTKKSAGANQGQLMLWLTNQSMNRRFNDDASGVGQKFFVNEKGILYSVLMAQVPLFSPAVNRYLQRHL